MHRIEKAPYGYRLVIEGFLGPSEADAMLAGLQALDHRSRLAGIDDDGAPVRHQPTTTLTRRWDRSSIGPFGGTPTCQ